MEINSIHEKDVAINHAINVVSILMQNEDGLWHFTYPDLDVPTRRHRSQPKPYDEALEQQWLMRLEAAVFFKTKKRLETAKVVNEYQMKGGSWLDYV